MIEKLIGEERIAQIDAKLAVYYNNMIDNIAQGIYTNLTDIVVFIASIVIIIKIITWINNLKYIGKSSAEVKGIIGEDAVYRQLNKLKGKKHILRNVYLPTTEGFTEVDMILIYRTGVFAVEVKNYSGQIWGDFNKDQWKHELGDNVHTFYNPIKQNKGHINWLNKNTKFKYKDIIKSLIVFGNKQYYYCENYDNYVYPDIILTCTADCDSEVNYIDDVNLNDEKIDEIANDLRKYTQISMADKKKHVQDIKRKYR